MPFDEEFKRSSGIGASEMWDAYCWKDKLYYLKLQDRVGAQWITPFEGNMRTDIGHTLEPHVLRWGSELGKFELHGVDGKTKKHPRRDWIFATVDEMTQDPDTGDRMVVECKVVGYGPHLNWGHPDEGAAALPNKVRAQVATQMAVEDAEGGYIVALMGTDVKLYRIDRCHEYEEELFNKAAILWDWIVKEAGFPIGAGTATTTYLNRRWSKSTKVIRDDEKAAELIMDRERFKAAEEDAKLERKRTENLLRERIGDDDGLQCSAGRATWTFDKRGVRTLRVRPTEETTNE